MGRLLLLFVLVPAVELIVLIQLGKTVGTLRTIALIVFTGVLGASLARQQGLGVVRELQRETAAGRMPAGTLVDGALILVAAALLVTPGVLTDGVGFALLTPAFRAWMKRVLLGRLERAVAEGRVKVHVSGNPFAYEREEKVVRDVRDLEGGGPSRQGRGRSEE